jgi:class 3 adenylate cyclase
MSRVDCISNRNFKIVASYLRDRQLDPGPLFEALPYLEEEYASPEDFFLNEDEWTTFDNYEQIFRRAKDLSGDPHFYFNCGASSARLRSWGRFEFFVKAFASPDDGFARLPFFNKVFNDTKEIEIVVPPSLDRKTGKVRVLLKIFYHGDMDANRDYIGDPYLRGVVSGIPTLWGMPPATLRQSLHAYDPVRLFAQEPEFAQYRLEPRMEGDLLTIRHPGLERRMAVAERVFLESEEVNGNRAFLGKFIRASQIGPGADSAGPEALLVTESVQVEDRTLLKAGEIFRAPYFLLEVVYARPSLVGRFQSIFASRRMQRPSEEELLETINQLRKSIRAKKEAYSALEKTNVELREAKASLDLYAQNLERMVQQRTEELRKAQEELLELNRSLESRVAAQVLQLESYNRLRRYLSPKLAEKILMDQEEWRTTSTRKMMTVVFSDIRGFSNLTDSLEPEEIFYLLNLYLSEMVKIVHDYDGTLNKIVGDGLVVFFNDPLPVEDHAERAVLMAIDMQRRVTALKDQWRQFGHDLNLGIGINTGFMNVGNIGPEAHKDYTVIGNQVNVAARLESLAKPGQILVSQRTYSQVKVPIGVEEIGEIRVKGIHHPVKTYNVLVP